MPQQPANKPVATKTDFTTQIWYIIRVTQPRLKTVENQLTAWDGVDKKKIAVP